MSDRPHKTDRLVEVGDVNSTRAVDRKRERVIQARICGRPTVPGVACESVPSHGSDDPVEIDPANALAEEVAEKRLPAESTARPETNPSCALVAGPPSPTSLPGGKPSGFPVAMVVFVPAG